MDRNLFKELHGEGLISDDSFAKIEQKRLHPLFSLFWEIRVLLYIGIVFLTSGLGILVYKNIDSIGHQAILIFIALVCGGCFFYCFKYKKPFSNSKVKSPNAYFDYILLLGTTSMLIFVGYLQYQYQVFGIHYGMATFIPMLALFYIAYNFDHVGILNMAIVNLGLWMGIALTPKQLLLQSTFDSQTAIFTYVAFGLFLLIVALFTGRYAIKEHFKFSYQHYGVHVSFIALLSGYFFNYSSGFSVLWLLGLFILAVFIFKDAYKHKSFYFLLLVVLYGYIGVSSLLGRLLPSGYNEGILYLVFLYFIGSAIGLIFLLINLNKKLKAA